MKQYKNIAIASALVMTSTFALAVFLGQGSATGNIWDEGGAPAFLIAIIALSCWAMFWAYLKSKGRSGWWVMMLVTGVIGLIIIFCLKNYNIETTSSFNSDIKKSSAERWGTLAFITIGVIALAYVYFTVKYG